MIRIRVHTRVSKKLHGLGEKAVAEAETRITELSRNFGQPHLHAGLGLRKLGPRLYEIRVWLQWRIVLVWDQNALLADDVLNHDGVRLWLKKRR